MEPKPQSLFIVLDFIGPLAQVDVVVEDRRRSEAFFLGELLWVAETWNLETFKNAYLVLADP